jgi:hypothetical protein
VAVEEVGGGRVRESRKQKAESSEDLGGRGQELHTVRDLHPEVVTAPCLLPPASCAVHCFLLSAFCSLSLPLSPHSIPSRRTPPLASRVRRGSAGWRERLAGRRTIVRRRRSSTVRSVVARRVATRTAR